jgi:hypothetical protein
VKFEPGRAGSPYARQLVRCVLQPIHTISHVFEAIANRAAGSGTDFVRFFTELADEGSGGTSTIGADGESKSGEFARVALDSGPVGGERLEAEIGIAGNATGGADEVGGGRWCSAKDSGDREREKEEEEMRCSDFEFRHF